MQEYNNPETGRSHEKMSSPCLLCRQVINNGIDCVYGYMQYLDRSLSAIIPGFRCCNNAVQYIITHSTAVALADHKSDFELTKDIPYPMDEL